MMKILIFLWSMLMLLNSCVTSKKYVSFIDEKLENEQVDSTQYKTWLITNTNQLNHYKNECKKVKYDFTPLIVYVGWNSTIACTVNHVIATNYIKNGIIEAEDSLHFIEQLKIKKLTITFKQIPNKFTYELNEEVIFFFLYKVLEKITPQPIDLIVNYQIDFIDNSSQVSGEITLSNIQTSRRNVIHFAKKFTSLYLDQYKKEMNQMGLTLTAEIINQIENR